MDFITKTIDGNALELTQGNTVPLLLFVASILLIYKFLNGGGNKKLPPGPIGLPLVGYLPFLGSDVPKALWELGKKYGDVICLRLGTRRTVIFNEYKLGKEAISHPSALFRAPHIYDNDPQLGFQVLNGEAWEEQRRFAIHTMRDLGLGRGPWESLVMDGVHDFLELLRSYKGQPINICHQLCAATSSNVISLLFGRKLEKGVEDEKIDLLVNYSDISFAFMGPSMVTSFLPSLKRFFRKFNIAGYGRAAKIISSTCELVRKEVLSHATKSNSKNGENFIDLYLEEKEKKLLQNKRHWFSDVHLDGSLKILFLGGSDTITSSLGWLFRFMAEYPEVQKKVQDELDETIGREGRIYYEERFKIPYTFAVMLEMERIASIVPLSTTRLLVEDIEIGGYLIPKGTDISVNLWALHNDPNYWEEPEKFRPERFLTDNNTKLDANKPSYAPFSMGRRNCPGTTVAWMEILAFFTSTMQKFTIVKGPNWNPEYKVIGGLVTHLELQPTCFIERPQAE